MKKKTILVIARDDGFASQVKRTLRQAEYRVRRARGEIDGLKKLSRVHPDLVVIENELPPLNRKNLCLRVCQTFYLPIIVLGSQDEVVEMLEIGADAYITKPPNLVLLLAMVRSLLRRAEKNGPPGDSIKPDINNLQPKMGMGETKFRR